MSIFVPHDLKLAEAELEFTSFQDWFDKQEQFGESGVVRELKERVYLSCLVAYLPSGIGRPNVYKYEFEIQGVFRADLVVGNSNLCKFVLVEFEGGTEHSLFGPTQTNQMRQWGSQLQHGF